MAQDVVVIGAGVVGVCVAYRLVRAGARVTLLDQGLAGRGTSANSFAWVNSNGKAPLPYHRLNAEGMAAHRRLVQDCAADGFAETPSPAAPVPNDANGQRWLYQSGGLEWTDSSTGAATLQAKMERLRAWGYAVERLDRAALRRLAPALRTEGAQEAALCLEEGWVDAPTLCVAVTAAAAARGVLFRPWQEVVGFQRSGERIVGVILASSQTGEQLPCDMVVIAAGRWSNQVAALAGVAVPLAPTCGLLAVTEPLEAPVPHVVHAPDMHFRPEPGGGLLLQSDATDATVTPDTVPSPDLPGCVELLRRVQRYVPAAATTRIREARVGIRALPADGLSIVGPVVERPGLYLAVTHSGVTLSALLGELVAAEIATGGADERLDPFRPARCVQVQRIR